MGAADSWQKSLLAKSSPMATWPLLLTPSGGGLAMSEGMMGVSIESCSMSLKSAIATNSTVS